MSRSRPSEASQEKAKATPSTASKDDTKANGRQPQRTRGKKVPHMFSGVSGFSVAAFAQTLPDPYRKILSILSPVITALMAGFGPPFLELMKREGRNISRWFGEWSADWRIKSFIKKYGKEKINCGQDDVRKDEYQKLIDKLENARIDRAKQSVDDLLGERQDQPPASPPPASSLRNVPR